MSQDTRKDKRAKVVSLNVRYKSATVDEFIENHSHDVSKGGIFVKTPTPFPPGTLLKFEIRLAGDKSVISGVGRVVWKREPTQAASDKPAGMGVKFIKIDDASRAVIDKLIAQKADAGSAYTSDPAAFEEEKPAANPTTLRGIAVAPPTSDMPAAPTGSLAPAPSVVVPPPAAAPSRAPAPTAAAGNIGAATRPPPPVAPSPSPGMASMQKTIPLGTSPLAGLPKPTPAAPSVSPKPTTSGGPPPPMAIKPATAIGVGPSARPAASSLAPQASPAAPPSPVAPGSLAPRPGGIPAPAAPAPRPPPANPRKATMMGVALPATGSAPGAFSPGGFSVPKDPPAPVAAAKSSVPGPGEMPTPMVELIPMPPEGIGESTVASGPSPAATSAAAGPMFPKMEESRRDADSVREPTVMKQAAELLEEALREAGGSLEEIGQNPLFSNSSQRNQAVQESVPDSQAQSGDTLMMTTPFAPKTGSKPPPSVAPASSTAAPRSVSPAPAAVTAAPAESTPPPPLKPVGASIAKPEKKGSGGLVAALVVLAVVVGGGVYALRPGLFGGGGTTPSTTGSTPSALPTLLPAESANPVVLADAAAAVAEDASVLAVAVDAGAATKAVVDAGTVAVAPTVMAEPPKPKPKPKPKPVPTATATATATSTADPSDMPTSTSEKPDKPAPTEKPMPSPTADPE